MPETPKQPPSLSESQLQRYDRQIMHATFDAGKQARLKGARVVIAGIGGLGGPVAWNLAAAGVGELILIHSGNLELPDLNRQTLMKNSGVDTPRIEQAIETLMRFNPEIKITGHNCPITPEFMKETVKGADLVIGARHNFPERRVVIDTAISQNIIAIEAAMNGLDGYFFTILPGKSACMSCLYPEDPPWDPFGFPVFAAVSSVIGSFVALEAVKALTRFEELHPDILFQINFATMEMKRLRIKRREDCPVCSRIE